jgi:hypothetical protein
MLPVNLHTIKGLQGSSSPDSDTDASSRLWMEMQPACKDPQPAPHFIYGPLVKYNTLSQPPLKAARPMLSHDLAQGEVGSLHKGLDATP